MEKINNNYALYNPDLKKNKKDITKNKNISSNKIKKTFDNLLSREIEEEINVQKIKNQNNEEQIEVLLKEIGIQGKILKQKPILEELHKYKSLIKKFISAILENSEKIEKKASWNKYKKEKILKVHLKIIDEELLELTGIFLSNQKDILKIAAKIDKIEGIIIDLKS